MTNGGGNTIRQYSKDGALLNTLNVPFAGNVWGAEFVTISGPCPWDLDANGSVGILDLLALLAVWGTDPGGPPDFDGDGTVGILDLLTLLANWGSCP